MIRVVVFLLCAVALSGGCVHTDSQQPPVMIDSDTQVSSDETQGTVFACPDEDGDGVASRKCAYVDESDLSEGWIRYTANMPKDCDDQNPKRSPEFTEIPINMIDDDCDGVDADLVVTLYPDIDYDGYPALGDGSGGMRDTIEVTCPGGVSYVFQPYGCPVRNVPPVPGRMLARADLQFDCDDERADVHPDIVERELNDLDENCDGFELCPADADGDLYGDASVHVLSTNITCTDTIGSDCDDSDVTVYAGAVEIVDDGIDNNCNLEVDEKLCVAGFGITINPPGFGWTNSYIELVLAGFDLNGEELSGTVEKTVPRTGLISDIGSWEPKEDWGTLTISQFSGDLDFRLTDGDMYIEVVTRSTPEQGYLQRVTINGGVWNTPASRNGAVPLVQEGYELSYLPFTVSNIFIRCTDVQEGVPGRMPFYTQRIENGDLVIESDEVH